MLMMEKIVFCFLLLCIANALSVTITPPDLQRKIIGESCTLQWTVTGTFTNYTISYFVNGNPTPIGSNSKQSFDQSTGVIRLSIWTIQQSNAGIYQLYISTDSSTGVVSNGILFVYANPYSRVTFVSGPDPANEGDTVELSCTVTSYSFPAEYRIKVYYFWGINNVYFQNISSGPAIAENGDVLPRYTIKNDGKTLIITSVIFMENVIACKCQEEGSPYRPKNKFSLAFILYHRPTAYSFNPASKKLTVSSYSATKTVFNFGTYPPLTSYTNWSFVSKTGISGELTVPNDPLSSNLVRLSIQVDSADSYGNYSITLTNSNGSTTETLQVMPPGQPDAPSQFSLQYVTHNTVSLQWRCMWFNGFEQTVFIRVVDFESQEEIETKGVVLPDDCYDTKYISVFRQNLQPDTQYEARIWSTNSAGSSAVQTLQVRTRMRSTLNVACEDISITGSKATIKVATTHPDVVWLKVSCCVELTAECVDQAYTLFDPVNQIVFDNLPVSDNYVFDFILFNGDFFNYVYLVAVLKGIRVSTTSPCTSPVSGNPKNPAVIVLAVLFGLTLLCLIGITIGFMIKKYRQKTYESFDETQRTGEASPPRTSKQNAAQDITSDDTYGATGLPESNGNREHTGLEESTISYHVDNK